MSDFEEMGLLDRLQVIIDGLRFIGPEKETLIEAKAEIERLRGILRRCQSGGDIVDIGDGEVVGLYLKGESISHFREIKQEIKNGPADA